MIVALFRNTLLALAVVLIFSITTVYLLLYPSEKSALDEQKDQTYIGAFEKKSKVNLTQHELPSKNQITKEQFPETQPHLPDQSSYQPTISVQDDSSIDNLTSSASSYHMFATLFFQIADERIKESQLQSNKSQDKIEMAKKAFDNALAGGSSNELRILIYQADQKQKVWIRQALTDRLESDPDPKIRSLCLVHITIFREIAPEILEHALISDPDRSVRCLAAFALGQCGTEAQVDTLFQAIQRDKGIPSGHFHDIADAAIHSLGEIGGQKATSVLLDVWNSEQRSRRYSEQTLIALGMAGAPTTYDVLKNVLSSDKELLRGNAVIGLGLLAKRNQDNHQFLNRTTALLRHYINDTNPRVRINVADAIGDIGKSEDVRLLQTLLQDKHSRILDYVENGVAKKKTVYPVREKAKEAIERINKRFPSEKGASTTGQILYREIQVVDVNEAAEPNLPADRLATFRIYTLVTIGIIITIAGAAILLKKKPINLSK